jgi:Leucine-rich repeat (LRR) protein
MKNFYLVLAAMVISAIGSSGAWSDEKSAVRALEKSSFPFHRDENQPGKPVIKVKIWGCDVKQELLREVAALKHLQSLTIRTPGDNVEVVLKGLNEMKNLQVLDLVGCDMTDFSVTQIAMATALRRLDLRLTGMTDGKVKKLSGLKQLQSLYINDEGVTDSGLKELAPLRQLQHLDLRNTSVGNAGMKELAKLSHLKSLNLSQTRVRDGGLKELAGLTKLKMLDLSDTMVTDAGTKHLMGLTKLKSLYLRHTKVTAAGLVALKTALPECQIWHEEK